MQYGRHQGRPRGVSAAEPPRPAKDHACALPSLSNGRVADRITGSRTQGKHGVTFVRSLGPAIGIR